MPILILSGCAENSAGESELSTTGYIVILGVVAMFLKVMYDNKENKIKTTQRLKKSGLSLSDFNPGGKYVEGIRIAT